LSGDENEENNELKTNPAHSAPVEGSDEGRAKDQATSENIKPKEN
jgi:hypothetical protein